ncbi:MAG: histidine phosphatase family protein [Clostridiaceae bacterium]|nr:histidine phosphatase family protein [Clostridiaceae bacterium]
MKLYMVRHGMTKGNAEHRYVGVTDEGILLEERKRLQQKYLQQKHLQQKHQQQEQLFLPKRLYVSPRKRCIESGKILFPDLSPVLVAEFAECDFGMFEYCNYAQLNGNPDYQKFIDTMGKCGFPGGEDRDTFQKRCVLGFYKMLALEKMQREAERDSAADVAMVVHGGTIMALLDAFSRPHRDYYDWQIKNGEGFQADLSWDDRPYLENIQWIR